MWWNDRQYVSAAQRRAQAEQKVKQFAKQGRQVSPVQITGRKIVDTFWGRAWCDNLQAYSDFSNRLDRGRTYVRNGSVIDLQVQPGCVTALVSGSDLYEIRIDLTPLDKPIWKRIQSQCAGRIGSLVDLLQGKLSQDVMSIVTALDGGLFPKPKEIKMKCSCPDYAYMCKHLAAVLYGIGARLDQRPELLFLLRKVDHLELITAAGERAGATKSPVKKQAIAEDALSEIFGIELESSTSEPAKAAAGKRPQKTQARSRSQRSQQTSSREAPASDPATHAEKHGDRKRSPKKPETAAETKPSKRRSTEAPASPPQKMRTSSAGTKTRRRSKA